MACKVVLKGELLLRHADLIHYKTMEETYAGRHFHIFAGSLQEGVFTVPTTFSFSIDDIKKTLILDAESCLIEDGKTVEEAD